MDAPSAATSFTRRAFVRTAALAGVGGAYFGGAHLLLEDARWTPNLSFWVSRGREPAGPPLRGEREADLAIIGGGVTGLSTALHALLRSPRLRVVLLEAHYVGFGAQGDRGRQRLHAEARDRRCAPVPRAYRGGGHGSPAARNPARHSRQHPGHDVRRDVHVGAQGSRRPGPGGSGRAVLLRQWSVLRR